MKKDKTGIIYYALNIIIIFLSGIFVLTRLKVFDTMEFVLSKKYIYLIPLFILSFGLVHLSKMLRYYIILMEEKINIIRFTKVYLKITFVNMALPLKSGELFRIYCFSRETKNVKTGIFSVVIDRFFDTCALLVILLPYDIIVRSSISAVTAALIIFVLIVMFVYLVFMPTYKYLNKFLIINTNSQKSILILHILEKMRIWYDYINNLLIGRNALIFGFSCMGWLFEFMALSVIGKMMDVPFKITSFVEYIESIFAIGSAKMLNIYTTVSCLILLVITVIVYAVSYLRKGGSSLCLKR